MKILIATALAALIAMPAWASNCAIRTDVVETLAGRYGEVRQGAGLTNGGGMLEVFASEETGTWTILVSHPNGITCIVASGRAFDWVNETPVTGDPT